MARDYRSDAYRNALLAELDPVTGLPAHQTHTSNYTMAAPSYAQASGEDDLEGLLSQYERRNEGAGGVWSGAGKGAMTGFHAGKYIGGMGAIPAAAGGALIGGIAGAFTKNAESARTDFSQADARDAIAQGYRSRMGREASPDEISGQMRNVGWQDGDQWVGEVGLQAILDSLNPENDAAAAQARAGGTGVADRGFAGKPTMNTTPGGQPGAGGATPTGFTGGSGAMVDPYTLPSQADIQSHLGGAQKYGEYDAATGRSGFAGSASGGNGYSYAGFDFAQDPSNRDVGKSAKYAWAQVTEQLAREGIPMPRTKAEAEAYAQKAAPRMAALGYQVSNIVGDKMTVHTREGVDEIDFLGDADGSNPVMTWQSSLAGGGDMPAPSSGGNAGTVPNVGMDLTSSALFEQLMKQVRDIAEGKSNGALVTDTNALLNLLAGGK
jgi:hypothetical protein